MAINIILPQQGQSVETCIIGELYKKKGDPVDEGEVILTFETDKAEFDLEAPASGIILEMFCETGDEVAVLTNIAVIGQPGEPTDEFIPPETTDSAFVTGPTVSDPTPNETEDRTLSSAVPDGIKISPRARGLASRLHIDISKIKGTGPNGKILEKDIENSATDLQAKPASVDASTENLADKDGYAITKLSNLRRIIAQNMLTSLSNSAQLTHHISANVKKILDYRERIKTSPIKTNEDNITINDLICYAVIKALKVESLINSHFLEDSIKTFHQVHLGIAVNTERGLMVPVLKNASEYPLPGLSRALTSLYERCKQGNIDPELLASTSASFTITNLGSYGIEIFTPVLNLPQIAILGINTITYRLEQLADGQITSIPFIGLSLTYDHRAIDGAPASAFLKEVKNQIEMLDIET